MRNVKNIAVVSFLTALGINGCRQNQAIENDGGGAQGASGLSTIDLGLPNKSNLSTTSGSVDSINAFQLVVRPTDPTCVGATNINKLQDYAQVSLSISLKQGCSYAIDLSIGQKDAQGAALKDVYLKNQSSLMIDKNEIQGKSSVRSSISLGVTDAGRSIGLRSTQSNTVPVPNSSIQPLPSASPVAPLPSASPVAPNVSSFPAAKDFAVSLGGQSMKFSDAFKTQYALVDFSRSTCGPCIELGQDMESSASTKKLLTSSKCSQITIIPEGDTRGWLSAVPGARSVSYEVSGSQGMYGVAERALGLQVTGTPMLYVIDRTGKILEQGNQEVVQALGQYCN